MGKIRGMKEFNEFHRQLTEDEIRLGFHRDFVGGLWAELGQLQLDFMKSEGLLRNHNFLDVGCGALRGGLWFIDYLDAERYCGLDINESLIVAGRIELERAGLTGKKPELLVDDNFAFDRFDRQFDFAIAQSVLTHLPMEPVARCLAGIRRILKPGGEFFATFFEAPYPAFPDSITHEPGGITTHLDRDPFHYSLDEFEGMARNAGLEMRFMGDWGHPRAQKMLGFRVAGAWR